MTRRITVSLDDEVADAVDEQMSGYGDNRSQWIQEAIRDRLSREAEA